jgi:uncharacterized protein with ParB-like and HNH nuclease domain
VPLNSITIREVVSKIHRSEYLMPGIQREFVWDTEQIELLFDSLLREYPISTFLFWKVPIPKEYMFYKFTREYSEYDNYLNSVEVFDTEDGDVISVLDGQQRLTSFYIGLYGNYAYKLKGKRKDSRDSFPKRSLYLDLNKESEKADRKYEFKFRTDDEHQESPDGWYKVSDIRQYKNLAGVTRWLSENNLIDNDFSIETLSNFFQKIHIDEEISFFLEQSSDIERVLDIFIRVNSGGTELTYSDLLLSMSVALWKDKDAKKEINSLCGDINKIGNGFNFNKDFILKSCLVLSELDIAFKVKNFNKENVSIIEENWEKIKESLKLTVTLLASFGYDEKRLTSNNSIIPIAYYLNKIGNISAFISSARYSDSRNQIREWINIALLKRTFGGQPDNVLNPIRNIIKNVDGNSFPYAAIVSHFKGTLKSMEFTEDEVDNAFSYKYQQSYTFSVLAFIYPTLDFNNQFHQDHIFPKKFFTRKKLEDLIPGINTEDIKYYLDNFNSLANIQLLEGVTNQEKSDTHFSVWINNRYPNKKDRIEYMKKNYIPQNIDLSLENFKMFIEKRKILIKNKFNDVTINKKI